MKNKFKILYLCFSFSLLFSIGNREDKTLLTVDKLNTFTNITGWYKTDDEGKWESEKNSIPDIKRYDGGYYDKGRYSLLSLDSYQIKEFPNLLILTITTETCFNGGDGMMRVLVFEKDVLKEKFKFKKEEFDRIKIDMYSGYLGGEYNIFLKTQSDKENIIRKMVESYNKKEYESSFMKFNIYYYQFDDKIQYFLSRTGGHFSKGEDFSKIYTHEYCVSGLMDTFPDEEINVEYFSNKYFESPFSEFQNFFHSLTVE